MRSALALMLAACSFPGAGATGPDGAGEPDAAIDGAPIDGAFDAPADATPDSAIDAPDASPAGPWRKPLVVTMAQSGASELTNFPLWIDVTDQAIAAAVGENTTLIDFRTPMGAALAYEIVSWDASTGRLQAWVRQTIGAEDRTLYLHYGAAALEPPNARMTFSTGFLAVWHLDGSPAGPVLDARGTADGTALGGMTDSDLVSGQLGRALDFDGTDDAIQFVNPLLGSGKSTISAWVKLAPASNAGSFDTALAIGTASLRAARFMQIARPDITVGFYTDDWTDTEKVLPVNEWHLVHWTYSDDTDLSRLYVDGAEVKMGEMHGTVNTVGTAGFIGIGLTGFSNDRSPFLGALDEVRIHSNARSAMWVRAEWLNQSAPQTFVVPGATEDL